VAVPRFLKTAITMKRRRDIVCMISSAHEERQNVHSSKQHTSEKNPNLPISFAVLLIKWQVSRRMIIHGHSLATISWANLVFPVLSDDIPEKFDLPM